MKRAEIEAYAEKLAMSIIDGTSYELVDVEYVKEGTDWYLRIFADKEGGITIDDCVSISRALEAKLDAEDRIPDSYILEVSSPGLGRKLKKEKDYKRSMGKEVEFTLYKARDKKKNFEGILKDFDKDSFIITVDGEDMPFGRKEVAMMRLAVHF